MDVGPYQAEKIIDPASKIISYVLTYSILHSYIIESYKISYTSTRSFWIQSERGLQQNEWDSRKYKI